jgi:hypothetical protein
MEDGLRVQSMSFDLAQPVSVGDQWIYVEPAALLKEIEMPLRLDQYINIGSELRIILEVGERVVKGTAVEERRGQTEYLYRPAQKRIGDWYRLSTSNG